jgi:hypothetical protein
MYSPRLRLRAFDALDLVTRETILRLLLEVLIAENIAHLRARPETPWLYRAGVVYQKEPDDRDDWLDIPEVQLQGMGDCEDLSAWRIAELRVRDQEMAIPHVTIATQGSRVLYHVTVRRANGRIEDPSRALGMRESA